MGGSRDPTTSGARGEEQADLEGLFRDHREELHNLSFQVVRSPYAADDVVQTVFRRLLQRDVQGLSITRSYLHRAIWHAALDFRRREDYRRNARSEWSLYRKTFRTPAPDAERRLDRKRIRQELADALEALPESQRKAVRLVHLRGVTYSEAARELDISLEALRKRLYRARRCLRAHFEERGIRSLDEL